MPRPGRAAAAAFPATTPAALMLAGHFGAGLALKSRYPAVPLPALFAAAELPDLLWLLFNRLGWEKLLAPPAHFFRPDTFGPTPFSHDLSMTVLYACIVGAVGMLTSSIEWSLALGLAVCSHTLLDVIVHAADIGVGGPWLPLRAGLDLWHRAPLAAWGVEMLVVLLGGALYLRATVSGRARARALAGGLALFHLLALLVW